MTTPTQCSKKTNGCFCDNVYVKNTLYTNLIQPRTSGGKVSIPALDLAGLECLNLTNSTTNVGCGAGGSLGTNMTSVGTNALKDATGNANVGVGNGAGVSLTIGSGNTLVGSNVSGSLTSGTANVMIGQLAGNTIETGSSNTIVGQGAGNSAGASLTGCVLLGRSAGENLIADNTVIIGTNAGTSLTTGINNTIIGHEAGSSLTTGGNNTILGFGAGENLTTGPQNVIIGQNTGLDLTTAQDNVLVGTGAGINATDFLNNAMFGNFSGFNTTGNNNTFIGHRAGFFHTTGSQNVIIGHTSGSNVLSAVTGCVLIGNNVGGATVGSNRLMIHNSDTNDPLIDGDFAGDTIKFNGTVIVDSPNADQMQFNNTLTALPKTESNQYVRVFANGGLYYIRLWED